MFVQLVQRVQLLLRTLVKSINKAKTFNFHHVSSEKTKKYKVYFKNTHVCFAKMHPETRDHRISRDFRFCGMYVYLL